MSEQWSPQDEQWEAYVQQTAKGMDYPPTPDLSAAKQASLVQPRLLKPRPRLAQIAAILLLIFAVLFGVPQIRAAILDFVRIGVVTIFFGGEPTPTPSLDSETGQPTRRPTLTPRPEPTPYQSVFDLPGDTVTLEYAREQVGHAIALPAYPPDLGAPDIVLLHYLPSAFVSMIWLAPDSETEALLVLQILNQRVVASKYFQTSNQVVIDSSINGAYAVWLPDPHRQLFYGTNGDLSRQVNTSVLIWQVGELTYRLEMNTTLEEAIKIAESLEGD